jgi:hypothetical protein
MNQAKTCGKKQLESNNELSWTRGHLFADVLIHALFFHDKPSGPRPLFSLRTRPRPSPADVPTRPRIVARVRSNFVAPNALAPELLGELLYAELAPPPTWLTGPGPTETGRFFFFRFFSVC